MAIVSAQVSVHSSAILKVNEMVIVSAAVLAPSLAPKSAHLMVCEWALVMELASVRLTVISTETESVAALVRRMARVLAPSMAILSVPMSEMQSEQRKVLAMVFSLVPNLAHRSVQVSAQPMVNGMALWSVYPMDFLWALEMALSSAAAWVFPSAPVLAAASEHWSARSSARTSELQSVVVLEHWSVASSARTSGRWSGAAWAHWLVSL
jgi:hypothetical protein